MRRSTMLLSASIVFSLTAAALLGLATQVRVPAFAAPPSDSGAVIRRFYDAVNDAIATGDAAAFRAVVSPDFVEHDPIALAPSGRDGLEAYLASMHATTPDLRLTIEEVLVAGDRVVARIAAGGGENWRFLGAALAERPPSWGPVDLFRVEDGQIVERWGVTDGLVLFQGQHEAPFEVAAPTLRLFTVERWTVAPGAGIPGVVSSGPLLVQVEAGQPTITLESGAVGPAVGPAVIFGAEAPGALAVGQAAGDPSRSVWLTEGQALFLAEASRFAVWNDEGEPVRLLVATLEAFASPTPGSPAAPEPTGVSVEPVNVSLSTELAAGAASILFGEVSLAPGGRLSLPESEGLLVVLGQAGTVQIVSSNPALVQRATDAAVGSKTEAMLGVGGSAYLRSGTAIDLWNTGDEPADLAILALRIPPASEPAAEPPVHAHPRLP